MDQHPVPQNITGFQFKLIGDMTVKQFVFLAGGILLGYLCTLISLPSLLKWPLGFSFGFAGFAAAFMPFEERSLDKWFIAFFKAIYSPTQYIWKKSAPSLLWLIPSAPLKISPVVKKSLKKPNAQLFEYLKSLPQNPQSLVDQTENQYLHNLDFSLQGDLSTGTISPLFSDLKIPTVAIRKLKNPQIQGEIIFPSGKSFDNQPLLKEDVLSTKGNEEKTKNQSDILTTAYYFTQKPVHPDPLPSAPKSPPSVSSKAPVSEYKKDITNVDLVKKQNVDLNLKLKDYQEEINKLQQTVLTTHQGKMRVSELISEYQSAQKEKERALDEITKLKKLLDQKEKEVITPKTRLPIHSPRVQFTPASNQNQKIPLVNMIPNLVAGVVSDSLNNVLPDVVIVIKDQGENTVRAMKTNKVGQFKTVTPLNLGKYTIELEKTGYKFDIIEIEIRNKVIPPLEIKAK